MFKTSSKKILNVPFEVLSVNYNIDKHFLLQGIKNHRFFSASIEKQDLNQILVYERKGMHFSYRRLNNKQTEVECYFPYNIVSIIVIIISLLLIIGFFIYPFVIPLRYLITRLNTKKVEKNYLLVFKQEIKDFQTKIPEFKNDKYVPPAFNPIKSVTSTQELKKTPPPFNKQATKDSNNVRIAPPPIPIYQENRSITLPPPIPKTAEYYIVFQGAQKGPLEAKTLKEMINLKMIDDNTLIWSEGMADWEKISKLNFNL